MRKGYSELDTYMLMTFFIALNHVKALSEPATWA